MNVKNFKNLNEKNFRLWSFFVLIINKQQIFWKKSSRIFIILFSCWNSHEFDFADLWFIIRFAFHDLTAIIQLRNILIHFIRYIFLSIWYYLIYIKLLEHIKFNFLFSWLCSLSHLLWRQTQISHFFLLCLKNNASALSN